MADNMRQGQHDSEEIDLLIVVERAGAFLSRYKKVIYILTLIGGVLGVVLHQLKPKSYESTLLLHSQLLSDGQEIAIVQHWNEMLQEEDLSVLKTLMHCTDTLLEQIRTITAAPILNGGGEGGFTVDVTVKNPDILPPLQKAIVFGLQNGEYVREKVAMRRIALNDMISTLNKEIAKIDSFDSHNNYGNALKPGGTTVLNLSDTNSRRVILQQRLNDSRDALKFINPIQVLQDFPINEKPRGMRLLGMAALGAAAGFFIGFLYGLYCDLRISVAAIRKNQGGSLAQNKTT